MIKQNEAVFARKKQAEQPSGVVPNFNRALRLLSLHFDNCLTALGAPSAGPEENINKRKRFSFSTTTQSR